MGKFNFIKTSIDGVVIIEPAVHGDNRGYFMETYQKEDFKAGGIDIDFVQDNQSMSTKGVLRGMHLQKNFPQTKLVRCIRGEVFDVCVDLREGSPTYGKWEGVILSAKPISKPVHIGAMTYCRFTHPGTSVFIRFSSPFDRLIRTSAKFVYRGFVAEKDEILSFLR